MSVYLGVEPKPTAPGTGAVEFGREVHRLLALSEPRPSGSGSGEAFELTQRFLESDLGRRAANAQRIEREFDFQFAVEDIVLRGQIDLWFEEAGELILVDYKTDRDEFSAETYGLQLRLYALALKQYAGRIPDRAVLFYLRSHHGIEVGLTEQDLEDARSVVRAFSAAQDSLDFPMKIGEQCQRCSFWKDQCEGRV